MLVVVLINNHAGWLANRTSRVVFIHNHGRTFLNRPAGLPGFNLLVINRAVAPAAKRKAATAVTVADKDGPDDNDHSKHREYSAQSNNKATIALNTLRFVSAHGAVLVSQRS